MNHNLQGSWKQVLESMSAEIKSIQHSLDSINAKSESPFLSRKRLAKELECSERFIQDSLEFRSIEHKVGGRIFYIRDEVDMIIRQSPSKKGGQ